MIQVSESFTGVKEYRGGSDETKPGTEKGVKPGSVFYEWDTGDLYMFDGTNWVKQ